MIQQQPQQTIAQFGELVDWLHALSATSDHQWHMPVQDNKWSSAEIVAHLLGWDLFLIHHALLDARKSGAIVFPDHDSFNAQSVKHVQSGLAKPALIKEAVLARTLLVKELLSRSNTELLQHITVNGYTHCPHTKQPYSLLYIVTEFRDHDRHHRNQIDLFQKQ